jgi:hypothetical protein
VVGGRRTCQSSMGGAKKGGKASKLVEEEEKGATRGKQWGGRRMRDGKEPGCSDYCGGGHRA